MEDRTRVFYKEDPHQVVVEKDGKVVAIYKSVEELIEHHVKGLLARETLRQLQNTTHIEG
jgi:hypothetical protein